MPSTAEVADFRQSLVALSDLTVRDLEALWRAWPWTDPPAATQAAVDVVPDLVWAYQDAAATLSVDQYDSWRAAEQVRGRFRASPAQLAAEDQILASIRAQLGPLWQAAPDVVSAQSLLAGAVTRQVMRAANDSIIKSTVQDPEAAGWTRHARADGCRFCRMLAARGAVYRSERTARFASHDWCRCGAAPSWDEGADEVPVVAYVASAKTKTARDREMLKDYLDENFPE